MAKYPKETLSSLEVLSHVFVISTEGRNLLLIIGYTTKLFSFGRNDSQIGLFTIPSKISAKLAICGWALTMKLTLDLSNHCIETALKNAHERAVTGYFRADRSRKEELEQTIDMTQCALEQWDFGRMRSAYTPLVGQPGSIATIKQTDAGLVLTANGKAITPILRNSPK